MIPENSHFRKFFLFAIFGLICFESTANATTCVQPNITWVCTGLMHVDGSCAEPMEPIENGPSDWIEGICKYRPLQPNERCIQDPIAAGNMTANCEAATPDCSNLPEKACFGSVPTGHWLVTQTVDSGVRRCKCGCISENSTVLLREGTLKAKELLQSEKMQWDVLSLDSFENWSLNTNVINDIIAGPEKVPSHRISTAGGRSIDVSGSHPMVIVNERGSIQLMKVAEKLVPGDRLVTSSKESDPIVGIEKQMSQENFVNFNVSSNNTVNHIFFANDLAVGDNAWQQYMANDERRILQRNDILKLVSGD
ncbi:MAG: Hint domain-containing protein [Pseudobdellovibrionaceae bacterium]|nr:Hint domain-containing protein [Pseudobdellovibrionaceae bacterium]